MSAKYHGQLAARYERRDRGVRIAHVMVLFLAVGLFSVSQTAAGLALVLGVGLTLIPSIAQWGEAAVTHNSLRREWMTLRHRWERLQRSHLSNREASLFFEELLRERDVVASREPGPVDRALLQRMLGEVEREMGLDSKPPTPLGDGSASP